MGSFPILILQIPAGDSETVPMPGQDYFLLYLVPIQPLIHSPAPLIHSRLLFAHTTKLHTSQKRFQTSHNIIITKYKPKEYIIYGKLPFYT